MSGERRLPECSSGRSLVRDPTLGVRFPKAKLNTPSTAAELVEHHSGRSHVHGVVPKASADRIERAILLVDTNILNLDLVLIIDLIFGRGLTPRARFIVEVRRASAVTRVRDVGSRSETILHRKIACSIRPLERYALAIILASITVNIAR